MAMNYTTLANELFTALGLAEQMQGQEAKVAEMKEGLTTMAKTIVEHIQNNADVLNVNCTGTIAPGAIVSAGVSPAIANTAPIALSVSISGQGTIQ